MFGNLAADKYDRKYGDRKLLIRLWQYFRPRWQSVLAIAILVVVGSLLFSLLPILMAQSIQKLQTGAPQQDIGILVTALFIVGVGDYVLFNIRRRLIGRVVANVVNNIRRDAFRAAINRDLGFYDENKTGKIVSRITSDTQELNSIIVATTDMIGQFFEFFIVFLVLLTLNWQLTLLMMLLMPVIVGISFGFRALARRATRQGSRAMAAVNDNIQESVTGISVAKNFRQEAMIYGEFIDVNNQSYRINLVRGFVLALVFPALNFSAGFAFAGILYAGAVAVLNGTIVIGEWFLFIQGVDRFLWPFINLSSYLSQIQQGLSATERIFALIDAENTVNQTESLPVPPISGDIQFKNVTFAYKTGEVVMKNFNLHIKPGESVAFVGHTGAGKSTIAKLISRFYEFQEGEILVDGHDIRTLDIQEYRRQLGIVPQQPFLFSGTVMENIRYARPDAPDEEIAELAHAIGNGEWMDSLPNGLYSEVGERGGRLSMGQRQLVSLMRVLVQKPAIFVLDEATASIDPFTEAQIQEALDLILVRSTSILIAHRLSTVRSADRIIVIDHGQIIEEGSHDSLLEHGGHYAELYNTYFRHQSLDYIENAKTTLSTEPA
ncbi:MAG: ABC transporter-like protein [Chloroflexi bacterium OLB15]|nr:MAG: ABC transporter-like protein [Chloroflexi bacterium OLB15]